jgi:hypothetical protein
MRNELDMSEKPVAEQWFTTRKVQDDLYRIQEVHYNLSRRVSPKGQERGTANED